MTMKTAWMWLVAFALACACARAQAGDDAPDQLSMLLTGRISIAADGAVSDYALDRPELVPKDVVALVDSSVRRWTFEPVVKDGRAVAETAAMSLGLTATRAGDGQYRVMISSASFSGDTPGIAGVAMPPPRYPPDAARAGVGALVHLVVLVAGDGTVENAAVEQVDLDRDSKELTRTRMRRLFADAVLAQAKQWTFTAPPAGADPETRTVRVPTDFDVHPDGDIVESYGRWKPYYPGPHARVPWLKPAPADDAPVAASAGSVRPLRSALVLKTPLGAS